MDSIPRNIYAVSELAETLRELIETALPRVWVEGEISNFSRPSSGHWYFTLKDARAQLRCAMFRGQNFNVRPQPRDGDRVLVRAELSFYTARGDVQLICEHLEPAGQGALLRAFEELKQRLSAEGLFDAASKRPLPRLPRRIGLITSATGAAIQDVLAVLSRRFPLVEVLFWPVPVQGAAAAPAIIEALRELPRRAALDLVLLVRGGGSLEDLWAFNEESVARTVRGCVVPVVVGVGHEIDFSIADFAADLRAPTPTAAAELVTPDRAVLRAGVTELTRRSDHSLQRLLDERGGQLARAATRLAQLHPRRALRDRVQQVDALDLQLRALLRRQLAERGVRQAEQFRRLQAQHPALRIAAHRRALETLSARLDRSCQGLLGHQQARWQHARALLDSVSPQAVLDRGYAIAQRDGRVIRAASELAGEAEFELILARGRLRARAKPAS